MVRMCECGRHFRSERNQKKCRVCLELKYNVCDKCGTVHGGRKCTTCAGVPEFMIPYLVKAKTPFDTRTQIRGWMAGKPKCPACGTIACVCGEYYHDSMLVIDKVVSVKMANLKQKVSELRPGHRDMARMIQVAGSVHTHRLQGWYVDPIRPSQYMAAGLFEMASLPGPVMDRFRRKHSREFKRVLEFVHDIAVIKNMKKRGRKRTQPMTTSSSSSCTSCVKTQSQALKV